MHDVSVSMDLILYMVYKLGGMYKRPKLQRALFKNADHCENLKTQSRSIIVFQERKSLKFDLNSHKYTYSHSSREETCKL